MKESKSLLPSLRMGKKKKTPDAKTEKTEVSTRSKRGKKSKNSGGTTGKSRQKVEVKVEELVEASSAYEKEKENPDPPFMKTFSPEQKNAYDAFAKTVLERGVEGLFQDYATNLKPYVPPNIQRVIFDQNTGKNRYKDIVCNDLTRVVITDGKGSDYIHANHVRGDPLYNEFICTQGPMKDTVTDFWRMIGVQKCSNIVMLCEPMEDGRVKCEKYWPSTKGEKMTFGDIKVENMKISNTDSQIVKSYLSVSVPNSKTIIVRHHHWKTWPDKSVPRSSRAVLRILQEVRISPRPTVVHCSAGIGRTGTLVAIEMCLMRLLAKCELNMVEVVKRLRDQRPHAVQVDTQFVYIAQVIIEFGKAFGYISLPDADMARFKKEVGAMLTKREEEQRAAKEAAGAGPGASATEDKSAAMKEKDAQQSNTGTAPLQTTPTPAGAEKPAE